MPDLRRDLDSIVAHMKPVRAVVRLEADDIGIRAEGLFAEHNRPGGHEIKVEHGRVDSEVVMTGPAPLSVEYGHFQGSGRLGVRRFVEGLHILGRAARL